MQRHTAITRAREAPVADGPASQALGNRARTRLASTLGVLIGPEAQAMGNRARARLAREPEGALRPLARPSATVQAKSLQIGAGDTRWEREADAVADASASERPLPRITPVGASIESGAGVDPRFASALARAGGGRPLVEAVRTKFETQFGHDLSPVRIHDGPEASALNRRIHARAFTHGADIFVGEGQPGQEAPAGQRLLAHELTHVIQQQAATAPTIQREGDGSAPQKLLHASVFMSMLSLAINNTTELTAQSLSSKLAALRAQYEGKLADERCLELLDAIDRMYATIFAMTPTPLDEVLSPADKEFVAKLARRDKNADEVERLQGEERKLEEKVKDSPWFRYRDSKSQLATTKTAIERTAREGVRLDHELNTIEGGTRMENLMIDNAARVVHQESQVLALYKELAEQYVRSGKENFERTLARKVHWHLGQNVIDYYESIRGTPYR